MHYAVAIDVDIVLVAIIFCGSSPVNRAHETLNGNRHRPCRGRRSIHTDIEQSFPEGPAMGERLHDSAGVAAVVLVVYAGRRRHRDVVLYIYVGVAFNTVLSRRTFATGSRRGGSRAWYTEEEAPTLRRRYD